MVLVGGSIRGEGGVVAKAAVVHSGWYVINLSEFLWRSIYFHLSHGRLVCFILWDLKAFEVQGLRAKLCGRKISDSIFWLHCFTPR